MNACRYDPSTYSGPGGADCRTGDPAQPLYGRCAPSGVRSDGGPGCCLGCIDNSPAGAGGCAPPNEVLACGNAGENCVECGDDNDADCMVPDCKQGACTMVPAPLGNDCVADSGSSGRCSSNGVCCTGCLTPGGICNSNGLSDSGACGRGGEDCKLCDDGDVCNGDEYCDQGVCRPQGNPLGCDDGNPCTIDGCDSSQGGCIHDPNTGEVCSDGNPCTTDDACDANGECKGGADVNCDDGNDCTVDECSGSGTCQNTPKADGVDCSDNTSTCGSDGQCQSGRCIVPTNCHDESNPCLTSDCDSNGNCSEVNKPDDTPCDDGDPCTTGDSCQSGVCEGGGELDCDDANDCTDDSCDPSEGCVHADSDQECSDGDPCTIDDQCSGGKCSGAKRDCTPTNACQEAGICDPDSGACAYTNKSDGAKCGDGGECKNGVCGSGNAASGSGGSAGDTGSGGNATGGSGGSGGNAAGGEAGAGLDGNGGTLFSGANYNRRPAGCDCRQVPGSSPVGAAWYGWLGLLAFASRRRRTRRALL